MKTPRALLRSASLLALFTLGSCGLVDSDDDDDNPGNNSMGGDANIELTEVGSTFNTWIDTDQELPGLWTLRDSVVITGRDANGIVTMKMIYRFDTTFVRSLDTAFGYESAPDAVRHAVADGFLKRFNATLDTSNRGDMKVSLEMRSRITSEGIQEFITSKGDVSKPFTVVKYGSAVGDKYEFTDADGNRLVRTVTYKSTTDDYDVGFFRIKVIKVEETGDPMADKVTFIANHKFGLVAIMAKMKNGKEINVGAWPN